MKGSHELAHMSRRRKILLAAILVVLALAIGLPVGAHFRAKWRVAAYKRELAAKGEKFNINEIAATIRSAGTNCASELMNALWKVSQKDVSQP